MAKTKTPFFSMDAHGTLAGSITAQKRDNSTLVRAKPLPAYRYTLLQAYRRWLYFDYAYLWTKQSAATRATYRSYGVRHHLTGFQYWMKYNLTHLPDIAGWWKLDERIGAIAHDSSKNANHGVILGATPVDGIIDGAYSFDGINDVITIPTKPSLDLTSALTLEVFIKRTGTQTIQPIVTKGTQFGVTSNYYLLIYLNTRLFFDFWAGGVRYTLESIGNIVGSGEPRHIVGVYDGNKQLIYSDGYLNNSIVRGALTLNTVPEDLRIGRENTSWYKSIADNVILYNRALDPTEILRHSERRYPV